MQLFIQWVCAQLSEPEYYVDLVYKLKKIVGSLNFSTQFIKIIIGNFAFLLIARQWD